MSALFLQHPRETDLALFAGGESGPIARWRIERHVENCKQCESLAAAYFRLPDQLSELAEIPQIDWTEMASRIEAGVERDRTAPAPERKRAFVPPLAWQAGLAVAGVVIMLVMVRGPEQVVPAEKRIAPVVASEAPVEALRESAAKVIVPEAPVVPTRQLERVEESGTDAVVVTDIAAPAAPPPPPVAAKATGTASAEMIGGRFADSAETAEQRLRANAAASVVGASALDSEGDAGTKRVRALLRDAWAQGGDAGLAGAVADFRDDPTPEMERLRSVFEQDGLAGLKRILELTE